MNFRGLIVAVVILAGLGGVLYWSQHRKPPEDNAATSASAAPMILKVNAADVTQLAVKQKQSDPVTLQKADADKWQITEPKPYRADQEAVAGMLSTLSGLNADRVVEDKASDRKQYGLDPATVELDITGKSKGPGSCFSVTTRLPAGALMRRWRGIPGSSPSPASTRPVSPRA